MEIYAVKINGLDHPMGFDFEHGKSETIKERNRLGQKFRWPRMKKCLRLSGKRKAA